MLSKLVQIAFSALLIAFSSFAISAQDIESCSYIDNFPRNEPLPKQVRERLMKLCIEENKKDFNKLIERSEQVAKLSEEIQTSYSENNKLSLEDREKLAEVEGLLKKIRKELRAKKDNKKDKEDIPESTLQALKDLKEKTTKLLGEIKKTTRHSVSAAAIQSSNAVLKIVKFLRFRK